MKKLIIQSFSYISILSALALSIIAIYASGFALIDPKSGNPCKVGKKIGRRRR